jgi:hypothetical protein
VTLTLVAIAAIGAAAYFYQTTRARIDRTLGAASAFDHARAAAIRSAFDIRSGQQAYVAAGQNEAFWFDKVTTSVTELRGALAALAPTTSSGEARAALTEASAALDELEQRDRRIRAYVSSGQRLLASDLIFSDGLELISRVLASLDRAGAAAARESQAARTDLLLSQMMAGGSAAIVTMLALLLLMPMRKAATDEITPAADTRAVRSTLDLEIRPSPAAQVNAPRVKAATALPSATSPAANAAAATPKPSVRLDDLAGVCTELARLSDTARIPVILERTAAALDAAGIVVWVADGERRELIPIAAHGYAPGVLSRMGSLSADSENATAAAFRTGLLQTVLGRERELGAVAAPLVAPSGCMGVMSAELRNGGEKEPARLAAASIVAAQLATIVGPPAAQTEGTSAAR